jgi:hypothetical protein
MKLLDDYFKLQKEIFEYFGYVEDWVVIPMDNATDYHWYINGDEQGGEVVYAETIEQLKDEDKGEYYANEIYTQRFLPKWVYRAEDYTMIVVDTHTDGNKFLQVFDNKKEVKDLDWE